MNRQMLVKPLPLVVLLVLLFVLPVILREFLLIVLTFLLINIIVAVSYRLITTTGLWSFTHISLMGIGGYTAGLLVIRLGMSFWVALPLGVLAATITGLIIGLLVLRTRGISFFLSTFAAGQAIWWAWILFREPFGAYAGIGVIPRPDPVLGISFDSPTTYYYLVLAFMLLSLAIMYRLENSRIGTSIKAIRLSEPLSEAIGINTGRYLLLTFTITSAFFGLAGVLFSFYTGTASPADYSILYAISIMVYVVVGGPASFAGPIIGTAVLTVIYEALREFLEWLPMIYGFILIFTILFLPGGLTSLPRQMSPLVEKMQMIGRRTMRYIARK